MDLNTRGTSVTRNDHACSHVRGLVKIQQGRRLRARAITAPFALGLGNEASDGAGVLLSGSWGALWSEQACAQGRGD